ncbi:MAG: hypothetical protein RQ736_14190 [Thiogranum sp.]|nr:hypothetical protein [Thiogranum sp.]
MTDHIDVFDDITSVNKPSMYATFGNKEQLYLAALERYREQQLIKHAQALAGEPDPKKAMRAFLRSVAEMLTAPELPGGCMVVNSAVACDIAALPASVVAAISTTVNQSTFALLKARLQAELEQRHLPKGTNIDQLVDYFTALMSGMAVIAKIGIDKERLFGTIEVALSVLPD